MATQDIKWADLEIELDGVTCQVRYPVSESVMRSRTICGEAMQLAGEPGNLRFALDGGRQYLIQECDFPHVKVVRPGQLVTSRAYREAMAELDADDDD